jgi:hypothetical protein
MTRQCVHYLLPAIGSPAGSSFATADDLLAFDNALREQVLLPSGYTRWFFTGEAGSGDQVFRGDDFGIGIAGGAPGVSAVMETNGRYTVVVLSNGDGPAMDAARALVHLVEKKLQQE